jgi:hypothetical protein
MTRYLLLFDSYGLVFVGRQTGLSFVYCDEPLLRNGHLSTDVIAMATNTENHPMTRTSRQRIVTATTDTRFHGDQPRTTHFGTVEVGELY